VYTPQANNSHLKLSLRSRGFALFFRALAEQLRVIRFDPRGTGMSQRNVDDFSLSACASDIEAVVAAAGADQFCLVSYAEGSHPAVAIAATMPERVCHLILINPSAPRVADDRVWRQWMAMTPLMSEDWEAYTEILAARWLGRTDPRVPAIAEFFRAASDREDFIRQTIATFSYDIGPLLPRVRCPALVVGTDEDITGAAACGNGIPGAVLLTPEIDQFHIPHGIPAADAAKLILDFTAHSGPAAPVPQNRQLLERRVSSLGGLTDREREVVFLLAEGLSSREIADRLVLSVRTVERHVSTVYGKLDVHSRAQLLAMLIGFASEQPRAR
jgi:DNA-binding CsgD family transcriptional regulator